ncbi:PGPGW domain-containing protein [Planctomicrobium sp. SH661]|uniref:PGPGW domain-containing protein n=1 Tax=Planctomicrobium sp. SH661 TaxID=3448124 RepID=UPI003F5BB0E2
MQEALQGSAGMIIVFSFLFTLVGAGLSTLMIIRMPEDQFVSTENGKSRRHPVLHMIWIAVKNLLGVALVAAGVVMIVLPGPGLLVILLGLSIIDAPGKQWLMRRGLQYRSVRRTLNWIRRKGGSPPLKFPRKPGEDPN